MNRITTPSRVTSMAHTTLGDVSRLTSTLTGSTTHAALCSADQAAKRALDNLRSMRASIRVLKKEARDLERQVPRVRSLVSDLEIPA